MLVSRHTTQGRDGWWGVGVPTDTTTIEGSHLHGHPRRVSEPPPSVERRGSVQGPTVPVVPETPVLDVVELHQDTLVGGERQVSGKIGRSKGPPNMTFPSLFSENVLRGFMNGGPTSEFSSSSLTGHLLSPVKTLQPSVSDVVPVTVRDGGT